MYTMEVYFCIKTQRERMTQPGLAVSSGGRFIPGFFRGFFRPEETISSSFFQKKVEETNLF